MTPSKHLAKRFKGGLAVRQSNRVLEAAENSVAKDHLQLKGESLGNTEESGFLSGLMLYLEVEVAEEDHQSQHLGRKSGRDPKNFPLAGPLEV